jgi:hypothetical protein
MPSSTHSPGLKNGLLHARLRESVQLRDDIML